MAGVCCCCCSRHRFYTSFIKFTVVFVLMIFLFLFFELRAFDRRRIIIKFRLVRIMELAMVSCESVSNVGMPQCGVSRIFAWRECAGIFYFTNYGFDIFFLQLIARWLETHTHKVSCDRRILRTGSPRTRCRAQPAKRWVTSHIVSNNSLIVCEVCSCSCVRERLVKLLIG